MPLRLARYGVPLEETAETGLAAANITLSPANLERLDGDDVREELPTTVSARELEPVPVNADRTEHGGQDEDVDPWVADDAAGHPEPELQPVPEPYEAYGPELEVDYRGGYDPYDADHPAGAPVPVAARGEGRPRVVQARIDDPEWGVDPLADEALGQSPIGDGQGGPFVPGQATELVLPADEDEVETVPEPEGLTGLELLEYRYLQLSPEERKLSAVKLAELLHEGAGFTPGTARKYLGEIIRKHR
jgi:hypothetical protein